MLNFAVLLLAFALVSSILVNLLMLIKFLSRAQQAGPAIGEFFSFLFMSGLKSSYRDLLLKDGLEPTVFDELLYRINIILNFAALGGLTVIVLGLLTSD